MLAEFILLEVSRQTILSAVQTLSHLILFDREVAAFQHGLLSEKQPIHLN